MNVPILVATPNEGFGELISQIIKEAGGYSITLVKNGADAMKQMKIHAPALCIVDAALEDIQILDLTHQIREIEKDIFLIVIPSGGNMDTINNEEIQADGFLPVPFYNPDLLSLVEEILKKKDQKDALLNSTLKEGVAATSNNIGFKRDRLPSWLGDVSIAAQHLARLSLDSSSEAAIIIRGRDIWAFAGELSQSAAKELGLKVERYFVNGGGSDLAKFIHLEETDSDYMLYATGLGEEFVLAMVFDSNIPFSQIRSQANKMANDLKNAPTQEELEDSKEKIQSEKSEHPDKKSALENDLEEESLQEKKGFLEELLEDNVFENEKAGSREDIESKPVLDETQISQSRVEINSDQIPLIEPVEKVEEVLAETVLSRIDKESKLSSEVMLESISPSLYNLTYACVLIPRFTEHFLTGTRASRLSEWITQLCLAFGWRLEQLSVRPEYIQWIVNVPPSTSPGYLIRIIRQHTSRRMFTDFPRLESTNPSGDFWAPGYLIMNGNQPPPAKLVTDFIKNSRIRQGV